MATQLKSREKPDGIIPNPEIESGAILDLKPGISREGEVIPKLSEAERVRMGTDGAGGKSGNSGLTEQEILEATTGAPIPPELSLSAKQIRGLWKGEVRIDEIPVNPKNAQAITDALLN